MNKTALLACLFFALAFGADGGWAAPAGKKALSHAAFNHSHKTAKAAAQARSKQSFTVAIDAGHGGKDTGAIGPNGILEKDVVLAIARRLAKMVNAEHGMRAVMVRRGDTFIGLARRAQIARDAHADLFISLHADAYTSEEAKGGAIFTLARRGARADSALSDPREHTIKASDRAAKKVLRELRKKEHLHYSRVQKARFAVLKAPDVPSMLIETGFVSNPEEERKLASREYQQKIARSIFSGIRAYLPAITLKPLLAKSSPGEKQEVAVVQR